MTAIIPRNPNSLRLLLCILTAIRLSVTISYGDSNINNCGFPQLHTQGCQYYTSPNDVSSLMFSFLADTSDFDVFFQVVPGSVVPAYRHFYLMSGSACDQLQIIDSLVVCSTASDSLVVMMCRNLTVGQTYYFRIDLAPPCQPHFKICFLKVQPYWQYSQCLPQGCNIIHNSGFDTISSPYGDSVVHYLSYQYPLASWAPFYSENVCGWRAAWGRPTLQMPWIGPYSPTFSAFLFYYDPALCPYGGCAENSGAIYQRLYLQQGDVYSFRARHTTHNNLNMVKLNAVLTQTLLGPGSAWAPQTIPALNISQYILNNHNVTAIDQWSAVSTTFQFNQPSAYYNLCLYVNKPQAGESFANDVMPGWHSLWLDDVEIIKHSFRIEEDSIVVCRGSTAHIPVQTCPLYNDFQPQVQWSFLWSDGSSGPGLHVSPQQTTTYTVTATNNWGFTATDQITVVVIEPPAVPVATGIFHMCHDSVIQYQVSNPQNGYNYFWMIDLQHAHFPGAGPSDFITSGNSAVIQWHNVNTPQTFWLIATDTLTGCQSASVHNVFPCCTKDTSHLSFCDTSITSNTSLNGMKMVINGTLHIQANVWFTNSKLFFGPDARIIIHPGNSLKMDYCLLKSCDDMNMWDGIHLSDSTAKLLMRNDTLMEARNGIIVKQGGFFNLNGNWFLNNRISVILHRHDHHNASIVTNNIFSCTAAGDMLLPFPNSQPWAGFMTDTINGLSVGPGNLFTRHTWGIFSKCSRISISGNTFRMNWMLTQNQPPVVKGAAIYASGNTIIGDTNIWDPQAELSIGGLLPGQGNVFDLSERGIRAEKNVSLHILNNSFTRVDTAIMYQNSAWGTRRYIAEIRYNNFMQYNYGIFAALNYRCNSIIEHNSFNSGQFPATAIRIIGCGPLYKGDRYTVHMNHIVKAKAGIWVTGNNETRITENNISIRSAFPAQYAYGIRLQNCRKAQLSANTVAGFTQTDTLATAGISLEMSPACVVNCNNISYTRYAMAFQNLCTASELCNNSFSHARFGLILNNSGYTGPLGNPQHPSDNRWQQNISDTWSFFSNGSLSPLCHRQQTGYEPLIVSGNFTGNNASPFGKLPAAGPHRYCELTVWSAASRRALTLQLLNTAEQATFPLWDLRSANRLAGDLYLLLEEEPMLLSDAEDRLAAHLYHHRAGSEGNFYAFDQLLNKGQPGAARLLGEGFVHNDPAQELQQFVNGLRAPDCFSEAGPYIALRLDSLKSLALSCPYEAGPAVYTARALLARISPRLADTCHPCEMLPSPVAKKTEVSPSATGLPQEIVLYPNPCSDQLHVITEEGSHIVIYNMAGMRVAGFVCNSRHNIFNVSLLQAGAYLCEIRCNNRVAKRQILLIVNE